MIDNFTCPVCSSCSWSNLETFAYSRKDIKHPYAKNICIAWRKTKILGRIFLLAAPSKKAISCNCINSYQQIRKEVLFNVWFPGAAKVILKSVLCSNCGFVTISPRPSCIDTVAKYSYLRKIETDIGGQVGYDEYARKLDVLRAIRIFRVCSEYLGSRKIKVLDYGGGNGKLMTPFLDKGHECFIVDYNDRPIRGVKKIGDNIANIKTEEKFDLIICSHVLEHVSNVSELIASLKKFLKPEGILYAEVPQEIWAGLRIDSDAVTHINFFTKNSFSNLFCLNSFNVLEGRIEISNYGKRFMEVIWVVAQGAIDNKVAPFPVDIDYFNFPSRIYSMRKFLNMFVLPKIREIANKI